MSTTRGGTLSLGQSLEDLQHEAQLAQVSSPGAGDADKTGTGARDTTPGACVAYTTGASAMNSRCTPLVQVQRKQQERARCTLPLVLAPQTRQERARCKLPLVLAPRTRQEKARCTLPLVLAPRTRQEKARCTLPLVLRRRHGRSRRDVLIHWCWRRRHCRCWCDALNHRCGRRTRGQSACRRASRTCHSCDGWRQPPPYAPPCCSCLQKARSLRLRLRHAEHPTWASRATSAMDVARWGLSKGGRGGGADGVLHVNVLSSHVRACIKLKWVSASALTSRSKTLRPFPPKAGSRRPKVQKPHPTPSRGKRLRDTPASPPTPTEEGGAIFSIALELSATGPEC